MDPRHPSSTRPDKLFPYTTLCRSCKIKNAGPFQLTIDVVFETRAQYDLVAATVVLGPELIGRLYDVAPADVLFTPYPAGLAFKATIPRAIQIGRAHV